MGALTQDERDGLDEVFLSIHSASKLKKIKKKSAIIFSNLSIQNITNRWKQAKYGLQKKKIIQFLLDLNKKKKNLSK
jgi:hypothetical protein